MMAITIIDRKKFLGGEPQTYLGFGHEETSLQYVNGELVVKRGSKEMGRVKTDEKGVGRAFDNLTRELKQ